MRTSIGGFVLADAVDPRQLKPDTWHQFLQPPLRAVEYLPHVQLSAEEVHRIRTGLTIEWQGEKQEEIADGREIVALDPTGDFIGILTPGIAGCLCTLRNMPTGT